MVSRSLVYMDLANIKEEDWANSKLRQIVQMVCRVTVVEGTVTDDRSVGGLSENARQLDLTSCYFV